jgi:hypothetical protein
MQISKTSKEYKIDSTSFGSKKKKLTLPFHVLKLLKRFTVTYVFNETLIDQKEYHLKSQLKYKQIQ